MNSTTGTNQNSERVVRHAEYYIHGGDVIFRVENTLFRVHRYFFTRDSAFFRDKLPHPPPPGEFTKGSSDSNPLVLEDTHKVDFERFLWVFYNPKYSLYDGNVEEWTSILKLSHQWDFIEVKTLALRELEQLEIPPLRKIVIYHSYAVDRSLLQAAYAALTIREEPITIEEGRELGLETALQLARAREIVRASVPGGKGAGGNQNSLANAAGIELEALIRDYSNYRSLVVLLAVVQSRKSLSDVSPPLVAVTTTPRSARR
ncbi:hypothetical protein B0F90DRAFT_1629697 [Multifurca ochricompacta]|uniref:BTB domain-containing protein n=1 Tax=Multifurca ochricompacta TaxID=376703 RepID=A0AAD4QN65_9AGAM|nr:hypothetical protein B0F90DRAFT_1629697 [Multifurca ochricompacta]